MRPSATRSAHWGLSTLVEVLQWRALRQADDPAYTFLAGDKLDPATLTYGGLERRARAVAAELQRRGPAGQRVLVVLEPGLDYIATLFGCFYAGAIAVPVYPPDPFRIARTLPRLQAIFKNAECELLVSSRQWVGSETSSLRQTCPGGAIAIEDLDDCLADQWRVVNPSGGDLALLQYTSGTTGSPRGVAITYDNLQYNLRAMEQLLDVPDAVATFWLPPYHDLGLIGGVFLPLFAGRRTVLMSPLDFVRRPLDWLRTISDYGATTSAAPNFGYELCVRKVDPADCDGLDLSRWQVAVSGAEPVRGETLDRFCEKFAPYGFRREAFVPAYGMAETTLMVSVSPLHKAPLEREYAAAKMAESIVAPSDASAESTRRLIGCGPPGPEIDLRIVDPQTAAPTDGVGEIWVRSPGVAAGYWRNDDATRLAFDATTADGEGRFLRTGDLGFVDDGELFIVGRLKETLILAGRNYYPQDIEHAIQQQDAAFKPDGGAVAAVELEGEERLVVFHEVQRPKRQDLPALAGVIRSVVLEETLQEPHAVVLLAVGDLPKTSSGKTRRSACWPEYCEGLLSPAYSWTAGEAQTSGPLAPTEPLRGASEHAIAELWSEVLEAPVDSRDDDFFALGGQSLQVLQMLQTLAERQGKVIAARELFDCPTVAAFAEVVDRAAPGAPLPSRKAAGEAFLSQPQPLSEPQRRMWMLEQLGLPGGANVPLALEIDGPIDRDRLSAALSELVARRQMLRTSCAVVDGEPRQSLHAAAALPLNEIQVPSDVAADGLADWALDSEFVWRPFDLQTPPLARAGLCSAGPDRRLLVLVMHHLICDGASLGPLVRELGELYAGGPVEAAAADYWDFLADRPQTQTDQAASTDYWQERLAEAPAVINLPIQSGAAADSPLAMAVRRERFGADVAAAVAALAKRCSTTPFQVYLAAWQTLLAWYSGDRQVVVGVAQAGRDDAADQQTLGCFMQAAPVAASVSFDQSVEQFLGEHRAGVLADLEHAATPWEQILAAAGVERVVGRMPLTQTFFLFENAPQAVGGLGDARINAARTDYRGLGVYDLTVAVDASPSGAAVQIVHDPNRLAPAVVADLADSYERLLIGMAAAPEAPLRRLTQLRSEQAARLLELGAGPVVEEAPLLPLTRFERQAADRPEAVSVVCGGGQLSYQQLDQRAAAIARGLVARGVQTGDRVGLLLDRDTDTLAAMLACWKAGAAYVPLDPTYPAARLQLMVSDCRPRVLLTAARLADQAPSGADAVDTVERIAESGQAARELPPAPGADAAAYVIYTSGSTGDPKGVVVPHGAVANFLRSFERDLAVTAEDRVLAATTISFDISVLELFLPLACGATVVLADGAAVGDGGRLGRLIDESSVSLVQGTPSTYRMLLATGWRPTADQRLLAGGEELTPDVAQQLVAAAGKVWNVYGPTETTIWSTIEPLGRVEGRVSIGRPIDNTQCYLLDKQHRLVPRGVWGELAIGGAGLAAGYHGQADLTAERFPTVDLGDGAQRRLYLTGDLARWRDDGRLEFGGRGDTQVKVRGHRIELGEIERTLRGHDAVAEAAVVTVDDPLGVGLAAYFVPQAGDPTPADLRAWLGKSLPEYMIPTAFVRIEAALPRNGSGKLDRKRLPAVEGCRLARSAERTPPSTPLEERLAGWWREVLRVDEVGVHDNFFELGGHSLSVMQLTVRIFEQLGVELDLREAYQRPTIAHWAEMILADQVQDADLTDPGLLEQLEQMSDEEAVAYLEELSDG